VGSPFIVSYALSYVVGFGSNFALWPDLTFYNRVSPFINTAESACVIGIKLQLRQITCSISYILLTTFNNDFSQLLGATYGDNQVHPTRRQHD
jgi:hypothetical protein